MTLNAQLSKMSMSATPSYGLGRSSLMCLFFHLLRRPPLPLEELLDNELFELLDVELLNELLELDELLELLKLLELDDEPPFFFLCFWDFFDFFFDFLDFFDFFVDCAGSWCHEARWCHQRHLSRLFPRYQGGRYYLFRLFNQYQGRRNDYWSGRLLLGARLFPFLPLNFLGVIFLLSSFC